MKYLLAILVASAVMLTGVEVASAAVSTGNPEVTNAAQLVAAKKAKKKKSAKKAKKTKTAKK